MPAKQALDLGLPVGHLGTASELVVRRRAVVIGFTWHTFPTCESIWMFFEARWKRAPRKLSGPILQFDLGDFIGREIDNHGIALDRQVRQRGAREVALPG